MKMPTNADGARLKDLRLLHGMTQKSFAEALSTTQSHLSKVERRLMPADSLIARATFTFAPPKGFFDAPTTPYGSGALNFRTKKLSARVMEAANATFAELERAARTQLAGTRYLNISLDALLDRSEPLGINQINEIADRTRTLLNVPQTGPVLNVTRATERAGIPVLYLDNPFIDISDIDGISSPNVDEDRGVIAVKKDQDGARTRFTRAHELGHLVMHTALRPGLEKVRETEAHRFAGAFLMPAADAHAQLSPTLTLEGFAQVKARYAMSIAALIRRAYELQIISQERYRSLNIQLSSRGWRKSEPVTVPVETPLLLENFNPLGDPPETSQNQAEENPQTATVINLFNKQP